MPFQPPPVPELSEFDFVNHDWVHGLPHTLRVMRLVVALADDPLAAPHALPAFAAALIHDMARRHSGHCEEHGRWSVAEKLPEREALFRSWGLDDEGIANVAFAVHYHCREDAPPSMARPVLALLKDADALDRVRFGGAEAIGRHFLHYAHTEALIPFAERLLWAHEEPTRWEDVSGFPGPGTGVR